MKKIIFFDTSYGSTNMGDKIINEAIDKEMLYLSKNSFVIRYGTHIPLTRFLQNIRKTSVGKYCENADLKFICGTNILKYNLNKLNTPFNISLYDAEKYRDSVLIGCGVAGEAKKLNFRTKAIYKKILSDKYIHSVRDEKSKKFVESLGLRAINTGCPTIWGLTRDVCKKIPTSKANKVIFTLTDYARDPEKDQKMLNILTEKYKEIYFWVQGGDDYEYLHSLKNTDNIKFVYSLSDYKKILQEGGVDYVGTRLHAGICAMNNLVRSIIVIIDNRARDMKESYNLPTIERDDIEKLSEMIDSDFRTNVKIDQKKIDKWKSQFREG